MKKLVFVGSAVAVSLFTAGCLNQAAEETAAVEAPEATSETEEPAEPVAFKMSEIACWDLTTTEEEEQAYAATLLYGYASGAAGSDDQSSEGIESAIVAALSYCDENPDAMALDAFKQGGE